jgi:hypothetical protein
MLPVCCLCYERDDIRAPASEDNRRLRGPHQDLLLLGRSRDNAPEATVSLLLGMGLPASCEDPVARPFPALEVCWWRSCHPLPPDIPLIGDCHICK